MHQPRGSDFACQIAPTSRIIPTMETNARRSCRFEATIMAGDGGGAFVLFPFDTQQEFGIRSKVPIKAMIAGLPYIGSLIRYGLSQHMLLFSGKKEPKHAWAASTSKAISFVASSPPTSSTKPDAQEILRNSAVTKKGASLRPQPEGCSFFCPSPSRVTLRIATRIRCPRRRGEPQPKEVFNIQRAVAQNLAVRLPRLHFVEVVVS
jgi:hypothetical protein